MLVLPHGDDEDDDVMLVYKLQYEGMAQRRCVLWMENEDGSRQRD
jgi:hypothetical protein